MKKFFLLVTSASVLFLAACQQEPNPVKAPKKGPSTSSARTATHVSPVNYLDSKGKLLVIAGDNLYAVDPGTLAIRHLANGFSGTEVLTWAKSVERDAANDIYYLLYTQSDHLYRYNAFNGEHVMFGSGWYGTEHMTTFGSSLVAIHQGTMYGVDYNNGHATSWSNANNGDWTGTVDLATGMSGTSGRVWGVQGGNEWQYTMGTNSSVVSIRALHGLTKAYIIWQEPNGGTTSAYYVDGNRLKTYNVYGPNPVAITTLGTNDWSGTTAMNFVGALWILKNGIIHKVSPTTGQILGTVNIPGAYIIESMLCRC